MGSTAVRSRVRRKQGHFPDIYDVIIVGAGPAGLSAALMLGRCRRRVLICDDGRPRNASSRALHGFLTRDGTPPLELLRIGRRELEQYPTVSLLEGRVDLAASAPGGFEVRVAGRDRYRSRKLLLATGVTDRLPRLDGIDALYGRSVFHCPYCDGWEVRDQPLAAYGRGRHGLTLALALTLWSRDLVLCTDGPAGIPPDGRGRLARLGVAVREERIARLVGARGKLRQIVFEGGAPLDRRALFFATRQTQRSPLTRMLGCRFNSKGTVETGEYESTTVPGLYVAGDASHAVQWVVIAAAEGAEAAYAINSELLKEDLRRADPAASRRPGS